MEWNDVNSKPKKSTSDRYLFIFGLVCMGSFIAGYQFSSSKYFPEIKQWLDNTTNGMEIGSAIFLLALSGLMLELDKRNSNRIIRWTLRSVIVIIIGFAMFLFFKQFQITQIPEISSEAGVSQLSGKTQQYFSQDTTMKNEDGRILGWVRANPNFGKEVNAFKYVDSGEFVERSHLKEGALIESVNFSVIYDLNDLTHSIGSVTPGKKYNLIGTKTNGTNLFLQLHEN